MHLLTRFSAVRFLFLKISNYLYRIAQDKGIQVIYGFPNVNYRQIQVRIERWKEVALFKSYELPSDKGLDNIKTTIQFDEIKDIDYEHLFRLSEMLASESVMNEVRLETNTNYWISRYMLNPQTPYLLYALSKCGVPIGYMVTKDIRIMEIAILILLTIFCLIIHIWMM